MKKIFKIILVISIILNSIPFGPLGKLTASYSNNEIEEISSEEVTGSDEIEYEIESLRKGNLKVFKRKDGLIEYNYYDENIHYFENNQYKEYNVELIENNNSYSNTINEYEIILPKDLKNSNVIIRYHDDEIKIKYLSNTSNRSKSTKKIKEKENIKDVVMNSIVEYKNILKHSTIELIHTPYGLKENIILDKYVENYQFSYILETNLILTNDNNTLYLHNENDKEIFKFTPYNIIDNTGKISYDVNLQIVNLNNGYLITVTPNNDVLKELVYPIVIDPVIEYSDTDIQTNLSSKYFRKNFNGTHDGVKIEKYINNFQNSDGTFGSEDISTLTIMEINEEILTGCPNVDTIKFAKLKLEVNSSTSNNSYDIAVNMIKSYYVNGFNVTNYDYEDIDGYTQYETENVGTMKRVGNYYVIDLSNIFKTSTTDLIRLELTAEHIQNNEENVILYGPEDENHRPKLTIAYMDNLGLIDFLTYHNVSSGKNTAYINDCFGNLVVELNDYNLNNQKQPFSISHYYNNITDATLLQDDVGYGLGFRVSFLEKMSEDSIDSNYYYIDESTGRRKYYKEDTTDLESESEDNSSERKYVSEEGDDEYLLIDEDAAIKYKKIVQERYEYQYDAEGYLIKIIDLKYNNLTIDITYASDKYHNNKLIDEIVDASNNKIKFIYSYGHLVEMEIYKQVYNESETPQSQIAQTNTYEYDDFWRLIKSSCYKGDKTLLISEERYFYLNDDKLEKIESYNSNSDGLTFVSNIEFSYQNEKVSQYSSLLGTNEINESDINMYISYYDRKTIYTNDLGQSTKYLFDYFGHTKTVIDNYGNTTHYKYANYNNELYKDNPNYVLKHQILEVSNPINLGYNLVDNHSFESGYKDWNVYSGRIAYISAYGQKALAVTLTNNNENLLIANQKITIETNKTYTLSSIIKGSGTIKITTNNENLSIYQNEQTYEEEGYNLYKKDFNVTSTDPNELYVDVYINLYTTETDYYSEEVYFDQIMINKNNVDTIYNILPNASFEENNSWSGGTRILRTTDTDVFGNYEMKIEGNSAINQTFDGINIPKNTNITVGGFINANSSNVHIVVQFLNSNTGEQSKSYVLQFYPYLTDYQFSLSDFTVTNEENTDYFDVLMFTVYNTGKNPCYVDNLILTYDLYGVKYEYNELGYITKKTIGTEVTTTEYRDDLRTPVKVTLDQKEVFINQNTLSTSYVLDNVNITENNNEYNQSTTTTINNQTISSVEYGCNNQYVTSQTMNDNQVSYTYNELYGLLTSVKYSDDNEIQYEYDEYMRLLTTNYGKSKVSYVYNDYSNIQEIKILNEFNTEIMSYYFEYNDHLDIEAIYVGKQNQKVRIEKYEYLYHTLSDGKKLYTGLVSKVIKGNTDFNYERYEYNQEYEVSKIYIKSSATEEIQTAELLYDSYKNLSIYQDLINDKIYMYNYDYQNRLISCLDEKMSGVKYEYIDEEQIKVKYVVEGTDIITLLYRYEEDELVELFSDSIISKPKETIDAYGRTTSKIIESTTNDEIMNINYIYNQNKINELQAYELEINGDIIRYTYTYDIYGNITSIKKEINNVEKENINYIYNNKQELILENITREGENILCTIYAYDEIGNIIQLVRTVKLQEYSNLPYKIEFTYNSNVKTKLVTYTIFESSESSGVTYDLLYDELGNIISDDENTYIYELDKLVAIQNNSKNITYEYDCNGFRTYKKVLNTDGTYQETYYNVSENKIIKETRYDSSTNTTTYIIYIYDESGVAGFKTGTDIDDLTTYYYVKNLQNDVIQIIDINSNVVVEYTYDAYGNVFISGTLSNTIGKLNPYRYRGYYYDEETQLFYCNSRYYSPELCRWISPDSIEYLDPQSINGLNLYCYCYNNPISHSDPSGNLPQWAEWLIGGALVVGAITLTIATAGVGGALATALGGSLLATIGSGVVVGAAVGAVSGMMINAGTQLITNGTENFSWSEFGKSAWTGAIAGGIAGGLFAGIKYGLSAGKIANSVSGLSKAQTRLNNVFKPLRNVKSLANAPFSGANIAKTVGNVAANYNSAYSAYILAKGTNAIVNVGMGVAYFLLENLTSDLIGMAF